MIGAIEFDGFDELAALWARAPQIAREVMVEAMWAAEQVIEQAVKERTPIGAYENLRGSIAGLVPEVNGDAVLGVVGTPANYAVPVELGTKPHFPPVMALVDWVVAKLGVPEKEAKGVAFLVARKISVSGTKGAHMFRDGMLDSQDKVQAIFERGRDLIAARLADVKGAQ